MDPRPIALERRFHIVVSNAALDWIEDHPAFLKGVSRVMHRGGRLIISCGGRGNAAEIFEAVQAVTARECWSGYFVGFRFPYHFYGPEQYARWLPEAGLSALRVALVPKDMPHSGAEGLAAWIRTTWLPYTEQVPESEREDLIQDIVREFAKRFPVDAAGRIEVK